MSQDYTVAKELASLKEIKQSAEQRISYLSLNALNYVNDHRLHKTGGEAGDAWPYFDVVVELNGIIGAEAGVYLKGSYETIKSAYDSEDAAFSMIRVSPKSEEDAEPAGVSQLYFNKYLTLQDDLSFKYPVGSAFIFYFNPDNTISAVHGATQ